MMSLKILLTALLSCLVVQAQNISIQLSVEWRERAEAWPVHGWWQRTLLHDLSPSLDTLSLIPFLRIEYQNSSNKNYYVPSIATSYGGFAPIDQSGGTICIDDSYYLRMWMDPFFQARRAFEVFELPEDDRYPTDHTPYTYTIIPFFLPKSRSPLGDMESSNISWIVDGREEKLHPQKIYKGETMGSESGYAELQWYLYVSSVSDSIASLYTSPIRAEQAVSSLLKDIITSYEYPSHPVLLPARGTKVEYLNLLAFYMIREKSYRLFIPSDIFLRPLLPEREPITAPDGVTYRPCYVRIKPVILELSFPQATWE